MAALPNLDRLRVWRGIMRFWSRISEGIPNVNKADLQAAVNAADDWADSNSASYNTALPNAFRNNATPSQKALLLAVVVLARYAPDSIKQALGVETE